MTPTEISRAIDYNGREFAAGRLTRIHVRHACGWSSPVEERWDWSAITHAIGRYQAEQGLVCDCKAGPRTRARIEGELAKAPPVAAEKVWPLKGYQGRSPIITSGYGPRPRKGKPDAFHAGYDLYIAWLESDPEDVTGYRYRSGPHRGERYCWIPPECRVVIAVAAGVVAKVERASNGYRYWLDHREHGLDLCSGYLHLDARTARKELGQEVALGDELAEIDVRLDDSHLHYEEPASIRPYRRAKPDLSSARVVFA